MEGNFHTFPGKAESGPAWTPGDKSTWHDSKYDPILREHMFRIDLGANRTTYLSPETQN